MLDYTVESGDCMSSIAAKFRLPNWKTLYDLPENAELKRLRPNPNLLVPGDVVKVPNDDTKTEAVQTDQKYKFKLVGEKVKLIIFLKDDAGKAISGKKFKIEIADFVKEGKSGGDGKIEADIPADEKTGSLRVWFDDPKKIAPIIFPLEIGALDPIEVKTGVKSRLANLGYYPGPIDDTDNDEFTEALKQFQMKNKLTPTDGVLSDATRDKIKELYGS